MSWLFLDLKFVVSPWVKAYDMWSVWPSSFTTHRSRLLLAKKWLMGIILYVALLHLFIWTKGGGGEFLLPALFTSVYMHKAFVLQAEPLTFCEYLFASTFWDAAAAVGLTLCILITLYCITSASKSQLFNCPPYFVGCQLDLSLGFAACEICFQSYFPSFSWLFLYNIQEKKGKDIDLYSHDCMGHGVSFFFFSI